jgi:hypothetical protein
MPSSDMW